MRGSEFAATFGKQSYVAWESAAFDLQRSGQNMAFNMIPVPLVHKDGRTAIIDVSNDYFSVGEPGDFLRLPLLPSSAQKIANLTGLLLPTPRLVYRIWQASTVKLTAVTLPDMHETINKGANFAQFVKHNDAIQAQLSGRDVSGALVSGHKKDVVVGNIIKPGVVLIFGWYKPSPDVFDDGSNWMNPARQPRQVYSNAHGNSYVDYSHGIRLISPLMTIDGKDIETEKAYTDAGLSDFVSHEGPVRQPRYPAPFPAGVSTPQPTVSALSIFRPNTTSYADLGAEVLIAQSRLTG